MIKKKENFLTKNLLKKKRFFNFKYSFFYKMIINVYMNSISFYKKKREKYVYMFLIKSKKKDYL
jgi:hypothetical protein